MFRVLRCSSWLCTAAASGNRPSRVATGGGARAWGPAAPAAAASSAVPLPQSPARRGECKRTLLAARGLPGGAQTPPTRRLAGTAAGEAARFGSGRRCRGVLQLCDRAVVRLMKP